MSALTAHRFNVIAPDGEETGLCVSREVSYRYRVGLMRATVTQD